MFFLSFYNRTSNLDIGETLINEPEISDLFWLVLSSFCSLQTVAEIAFFLLHYELSFFLDLIFFASGRKKVSTFGCPILYLRAPQPALIYNDGARAQRLINLETPVLVRSLKSSNIELD